MKSNGVNTHQRQHHVTSAKAVMWFYELKEKQTDKNPETTQINISALVKMFASCASGTALYLETIAG